MSRFGIAKALSLLDDYDYVESSDIDECIDDKNNDITIHVYDTNTVPSTVVTELENLYELKLESLIAPGTDKDDISTKGAQASSCKDYECASQ